jgi:hypothetical protein
MLLVSTARISFFWYGSAEKKAVISSIKMAIFYTTEVVCGVKNNSVQARMSCIVALTRKCIRISVPQYGLSPFSKKQPH